ncbi:hypothetical protein DVH05_023697 [Phytophthora capsici]|nr:hypothetical protein DVH05_023687 [Phytophthora capsici]KAG1693232.1 hypothetical protein DVH05_023697 [Phytophthora capsici]
MQSCIGSFPKEIGRWKASVLKNEGRDDVRASVGTPAATQEQSVATRTEEVRIRRNTQQRLLRFLRTTNSGVFQLILRRRFYTNLRSIAPTYSVVGTVVWRHPML